MAAEITASASLQVDNGIFDEALSKVGIHFDWTTHKYTKTIQAIGTSEEAIDLGEVTSLGWIMAVNLDNTNYVELRLGTGASLDMIKLPAKGGLAIFHAGSDMSAPFAIANTASCNVAFLICSQ